jgi:hypothetical protein
VQPGRSFSEVSEVSAASIIRSASEISVNFYQTTLRNNQEDGHLLPHGTLQAYRWENLVKRLSAAQFYFRVFSRG